MKDPAILFYPSDFLAGTIAFSRHQKGAYLDLLIAQFNIGHMTLEEIQSVLGVDFPLWEAKLKSKFIEDENGKFYNKRWEFEVNKRKSYTGSKRESLETKDTDQVYIFLLLDPEKNFYKICASKYPELRLNEMKKKMPSVSLFWQSNLLVERINEKNLKAKFTERRAFYDWYRLTDNDIQFIKSSVGGAGIEIVTAALGEMAFFKINGNIYRQNVSEYFNQNFALFREQWLMKNDTELLSEVISELDVKYHSTDFASPNHIKNAFTSTWKIVKDGKLKNNGNRKTDYHQRKTDLTAFDSELKSVLSDPSNFQLKGGDSV